MAISKNIQDYFPIRLAELKPGERLSFDLHLFFPQNRHVILWRNSGELISVAFLKKYQSRGLATVWVHQKDSKAFEEYKTPKASAQRGRPTARLADEIADAIAEAAANAVETESGIGENKSALEIQAVAKAGEMAQELLSKSAAPGDLNSQAKINQELKCAVIEILEKTLANSLSDVSRQALAQVKEIWKLASIDPDLEHGVDVATFAVIFAMAFQRIDPSLLADLALAGLVHDIGMSQIPSHLAVIPWKSLTPDQLSIYARHVDATISLLSRLSPNTSPRVIAMVSQHHEKFDGTGYPRGLRGFKVDDVSQLLSIADVVTSFASGRWDGVRRTLAETFEMLDKLEKSSVFPEYFNPDIFQAITRWIRNSKPEEISENAIAVVKDQTRNIVQRFRQTG